MEIGKPKKVHEIEPITTPVPEPIPEPVPEPAEEPVEVPASGGMWPLHAATKRLVLSTPSGGGQHLRITRCGSIRSCRTDRAQWLHG
jgi:outer membrane biosynthesis protein TonB